MKIACVGLGIDLSESVAYANPCTGDELHLKMREGRLNRRVFICTSQRAIPRLFHGVQG